MLLIKTKNKEVWCRLVNWYTHFTGLKFIAHITLCGNMPFDGKLCQEYSSQKLSKFDNFSSYSQKCQGCFLGYSVEVKRIMLDSQCFVLCQDKPSWCSMTEIHTPPTRTMPRDDWIMRLWLLVVFSFWPHFLDPIKLLSPEIKEWTWHWKELWIFDCA